MKMSRRVKGAACDGEVQLMADGCVALLRMVMGDDNWQRWNELRQHAQLADFHTFVTWLLDLAEGEMTKDNLYEGVMEPEGSSDASAYPYLPPAASSLDDLQVTPPDIKGDVGGGTDEVRIIGSTPAPRLIHHNLPPPSSLISSAVDSPSLMTSQTDSVEFIFLNDSNNFYCNVCKVSLSDIEIVREHMNLRHEATRIIISCCCCSKKFSSPEDYVQFHKDHASTMRSAKSRYVCNFCAKAYPSKQRLEDHIANKHEKTGPRYECPNCAKRFSHQTGYAAHKKKCSLGPMYALTN